MKVSRAEEWIAEWVIIAVINGQTTSQRLQKIIELAIAEAVKSESFEAHYQATKKG